MAMTAGSRSNRVAPFGVEGHRERAWRVLEGNADLTRPVFGLLLIAAAVLQTALLPRWQLLAVTPGLVVVLLLGWSAYRGVGKHWSGCSSPVFCSTFWVWTD
jgi:hypothetical protein